VEFRFLGATLSLGYAPNAAPAVARTGSVSDAPAPEAAPAGEEEPGRVQAEVVSFYGVGDGRVNAVEKIRFRIHNVPVSRFALRLPVTTDLVRCDAEGIEAYRRDGATLEVRLLSPKLGTVDLSLETETTLGTAPVAVLPIPEPVGVAAVNGLFGLAARTNVEFTLDPDRSRRLKRVGPPNSPPGARCHRPPDPAPSSITSPTSRRRSASARPAAGLAACVDSLAVDATATAGGALFGRALFLVKNNGLAYLPFAFDGTVEILDASVDGAPVKTSCDADGSFKVRLPDGAAERQVPVSVTWRTSGGEGSDDAVAVSAPRAALPVMAAVVRLHAPEDRVFFSFKPESPLAATPDAPFPFKIVPATLALLAGWFDDEERAGLSLFIAFILVAVAGLALWKRRRAKVAAAPWTWKPVGLRRRARRPDHGLRHAA
jgi:hypothetical protein